jgi:DNA replication protein DnaC
MELSSVASVFNPEFYGGRCEIHGGFVGKRFTIAGREMDSGCPLCAKASQKARAAQESEELRAKSIAHFAQKAAEARRKAGIPPRFDDRTFASFVTDTPGRTKAKAAMQALAGDLKAGGKGHNVILAGRPGTGKSHLCSAVVHELYESKLVRRVVLADLGREPLDDKVL